MVGTCTCGCRWWERVRGEQYKDYRQSSISFSGINMRVLSDDETCVNHPRNEMLKRKRYRYFLTSTVLIGIKRGKDAEKEEP
jgi:hypothetical protein